jgi:hypothetical protein
MQMLQPFSGSIQRYFEEIADPDRYPIFRSSAPVRQLSSVRSIAATPRSSLQKLLYLVPWEVFRTLGENGNSRRWLARQIQFELLQ